MIRDIHPSLVAKNGGKLKVLAVCRISTLKQDEKSLEDQEASYRQWLDTSTQVPYELEVIATQGSGECIDRAEYLDAIERVESGLYDLVITEDLGRICRRVHAHIFCESCQDEDTRLIALNDNIDTGIEGWEMNSFFAAMRHESYNRDTSQRIRRTLRNRFMQGGVVQCEIFGYLKPSGATTDADLSKDPAAETLYDEWFRLLEEGASYSEVADWMNALGIPTGPYCRSDTWTGRMVGRITFNPILKGLRQRNRKMSRRVNKTGRRKSVAAPPEDLLERDCPHLAFIDPVRYDRVICQLKERNAKYRRGLSGGIDPRKNVPKKRTRWPGQSVLCGICGRNFVFGGHGQTDHLMCSGAREYQCWNGITFDGPTACNTLSLKLFEQISKLPGFDSQFMTELHRECELVDGDRTKRSDEIAHQIGDVERKASNIVRAIGELGTSPILSAELRSLETKLGDLRAEQSELAESPRQRLVLPSVAEIGRIAKETFKDLASDSQEFARQMRRIVEQIFVHPHRLCDGGHPVLRAEVKFSLVPFVSKDASGLSGLGDRLSGTFIADLFVPPQRAVFRDDVVRLTQSTSLTERQIASQLGITQPAVQYAKKLARQMKRLGLSDPYVTLTGPPADYAKLKRHNHHRYEFTPRDGFPRHQPD